MLSHSWFSRQHQPRLHWEEKEEEGRKESGKCVTLFLGQPLFHLQPWSGDTEMFHWRTTTLHSHLQRLPAILPPQSQDDPPGSWPRCSSLAHVTWKKGQNQSDEWSILLPFPWGQRCWGGQTQAKVLAAALSKTGPEHWLVLVQLPFCWPETSSHQPAQPSPPKQNIPMGTESQLGR